MRVNQKSNILTFIAVSIICLTSCGPKSESEKTSPQNVNVHPDFSEFVAAMANHDLPLEIGCGLPDGTPSVGQFEKFKSFIPKSADRVFGTIGNVTEKRILIIYGRTGDDIFPTVYSYTNNGKIKDSLALVLDPCGRAHESQIPNSHCTIEKDLTMILTDTLKLIHYNRNINVDVYTIDSIRITRLVKKIDDAGHFNTIRNYSGN